MNFITEISKCGWMLGMIKGDYLWGLKVRNFLSIGF